MKKLTVLLMALIFITASGCAMLFHDNGHHGKRKKVWKNGRYHYVTYDEHDNSENKNK